MNSTELRELRDYAGMTQAEMAGMLRVSRETYRSWEGGRRSIPHLLEPALQTLLPRRHAVRTVRATVWDQESGKSATAAGATLHGAIWGACQKMGRNSEWTEIRNLDLIRPFTYRVVLAKRTNLGHEEGPTFVATVSYIDFRKNQQKIHEGPGVLRP